MKVRQFISSDLKRDWNYFEAGSTLCKNQSNKFFWCCCWSIEDICPSLSLLPVILVFCQGWCPLSGTMSFSGWFGTKCSSTTHPCQHLPTIDIDSAENIKIFCKILRSMSIVHCICIFLLPILAMVLPDIKVLNGCY